MNTEFWKKEFLVTTVFRSSHRTWLWEIIRQHDLFVVNLQKKENGWKIEMPFGNSVNSSRLRGSWMDTWNGSAKQASIKFIFPFFKAKRRARAYSWSLSLVFVCKGYSRNCFVSFFSFVLFLWFLQRKLFWTRNEQLMKKKWKSLKVWQIHLCSLIIRHYICEFLKDHPVMSFPDFCLLLFFHSGSYKVLLVCPLHLVMVTY